MNSIRLDQKHGVNPAITRCFYCGGDKDIAIFGHIPDRTKWALEKAGAEVIDGRAPSNLVMDMEPCHKCKEYMEMGVILISCREPIDFQHRTHSCGECKHVWITPVEQSAHTSNLSGEKSEECPECSSRNVHSSRVQEAEDPQNPYRTGGWVVVRDEAIERMVSPPELTQYILKKRVAFIPDEAWEILGLPCGGQDDG